MRADLPDWRGRDVVCIASGPSLTREDVELVRAAGLPVVVCNTSFRLAPWADALFAFDFRYWGTVDPATGISYFDETSRDFRGLRYCRSELARNIPGLISCVGRTWFWGFGNSGICAITLAQSAGARRAILLGYDCKLGPGGLPHWHGKHPEPRSNCLSLPKWPEQFLRLSKICKARGFRVVNATRDTALQCFPRMSLEQALELRHSERALP